VKPFFSAYQPVVCARRQWRRQDTEVARAQELHAGEGSAADRGE